MEKEIIAKVAGQTLTEEDFKEFLMELPREQQAYLADPGAKEYFKKEMVSIYLYEQYGEELKLDETEEFKNEMKRLRRSVLSQMAMQKVVNAVTVTEEEKKEFFEANKASYAKGETARAKHILMKEKEEILKVKQEIEDGVKTFEAAAAEYSTCPSGQRGGDLGEFGRGQMVKEFEDAVFNGELNKVIGPVETQFGQHLILVEKLERGDEVKFEDCAERVGQDVLRQKQKKAYTDKVEELTKQYCE